MEGDKDEREWYFLQLILTGNLNFSTQGRSVCTQLVEAISDYYWKHGQVRNKKTLPPIERLLVMPQTVAKPVVQAVYIRTRLVKGQAGSGNNAKRGYFAYLTELLRQVEVE